MVQAAAEAVDKAGAKAADPATGRAGGRVRAGAGWAVADRGREASVFVRIAEKSHPTKEEFHVMT